MNSRRFGVTTEASRIELVKIGATLLRVIEIDDETMYYVGTTIRQMHKYAKGD